MKGDDRNEHTSDPHVHRPGWVFDLARLRDHVEIRTLILYTSMQQTEA